MHFRHGVVEYAQRDNCFSYPSFVYTCFLFSSGKSGYVISLTKCYLFEGIFNVIIYQQPLSLFWELTV